MLNVCLSVSTNMLEVCAALVAVNKLVNEDMIPALIGDVLPLLRHEMDAVRKKAIGALHRCYQIDKKYVLDHMDKVRRALCDKGAPRHTIITTTLQCFTSFPSSLSQLCRPQRDGGMSTSIPSHDPRRLYAF